MQQRAMVAEVRKLRWSILRTSALPQKVTVMGPCGSAEVRAAPLGAPNHLRIFCGPADLRKSRNQLTQMSRHT
jgi:hypothetical protein